MSYAVHCQAKLQSQLLQVVMLAGEEQVRSATSLKRAVLPSHACARAALPKHDAGSLIAASTQVNTVADLKALAARCKMCNLLYNPSMYMDQLSELLLLYHEVVMICWLLLVVMKCRKYATCRSVSWRTSARY